MINQVNKMFDDMLIKKPLTKQEMINKINDIFDRLLIENV